MSEYNNTPETISSRAALVGALLNAGTFDTGDTALVKWAVAHGLGAMLYYLHCGKLPEAVCEICRRQYRFAAAQDLRYSAAFSEIQKIFVAEKIDYIPLKGMALIRQGVYANGALRLHCDMDLLLRGKNECRRGFDILRKNGWKVSGQPDFYQHIPALHKNQVCIELHHQLPGVDDESKINSFWQNEAMPLSGGEYAFSREFHFALAFAHCGNHHDWENGAKFLLDAGMLSANETFDWEKCFHICHEFGIGNPEVLKSAFPEVFGGGNAVPDSCLILRERVLGDYIPFVALEVTAKDRFSFAWFKRHTGSMSISRLRGRYDAENAPWYKMIRIFWLDFLHKFRTFRRYCFSSSGAGERKKASDACRKLLGITENPNKL